MPFAMEPVVYDFAINEHGTQAGLLGSDALMPAGYYTLSGACAHPDRGPAGCRRCAAQSWTASPTRAAATPRYAGMIHTLFDRTCCRARQDAEGDQARTLRALLESYGFDRVQHEQIRADLRSGRIGLAQNRLPATSHHSRMRRRIVSMTTAIALRDWRCAWPGPRRRGVAGRRRGHALDHAAPASSRRSIPSAGCAGRHRNFIEVHLAKSLRVSRQCGTPLPHIVTTSYLTHEAIAAHLAAKKTTATRVRFCSRRGAASACA